MLHVRDTIIDISKPIDRSIPRVQSKPIRASWTYQLRSKARHGSVQVYVVSAEVMERYWK